MDKICFIYVISSLLYGILEFLLETVSLFQFHRFLFSKLKLSLKLISLSSGSKMCSLCVNAHFVVAHFYSNLHFFKKRLVLLLFCSVLFSRALKIS